MVLEHLKIQAISGKTEIDWSRKHSIVQAYQVFYTICILSCEFQIGPGQKCRNVVIMRLN